MLDEVQEHPAPTDREVKELHVLADLYELLRQAHSNELQAISKNSLSVRACMICKGKCTF